MIKSQFIIRNELRNYP